MFMRHFDRIETTTCPSGKRLFKTKAFALMNGNRMRSTKEHVPNLFAYRCPSCRYWHLTKTKQRR